MAIEIAMNAKWYHIVTLKIRVSRISNIKVASGGGKRPRKVGERATDCGIEGSGPRPDRLIVRALRNGRAA